LYKTGCSSVGELHFYTIWGLTGVVAPIVGGIALPYYEQESINTDPATGMRIAKTASYSMLGVVGGLTYAAIAPIALPATVVGLGFEWWNRRKNSSTQE
jgi:hypothetical protein